MQVNILTAIVVAVMATATAAQTGGSCPIEINEAYLDQFIEAKVNSMLADEPGTFTLQPRYLEVHPKSPHVKS